VKLRHIREWNERRAQWASVYADELAGINGVTTPKIRPAATHVFHVYCIRTPRRDELREFLERRGIHTGIHYPRALPFLAAYARYGHTAADFPVAYAHQDQILSLPMYPELTREMVSHVAGTIREFFAASV
jgi:dTDP-4-amino-4,6-dideoxygalactose transaminase